MLLLLIYIQFFNRTIFALLPFLFGQTWQIFQHMLVIRCDSRCVPSSFGRYLVLFGHERFNRQHSRYWPATKNSRILCQCWIYPPFLACMAFYLFMWYLILIKCSEFSFEGLQGQHLVVEFFPLSLCRSTINYSIVASS